MLGPSWNASPMTPKDRDARTRIVSSLSMISASAALASVAGLLWVLSAVVRDMLRMWGAM